MPNYVIQVEAKPLYYVIYTHHEVVLGISGQEIAWNFDFSIEQNQRFSNAKSRILRLRKI